MSGAQQARNRGLAAENATLRGQLARAQALLVELAQPPAANPGALTRDEFLALVEAYCRADPEAVPALGEAARRGIAGALAEARARAADMEVVACVALAKRGSPAARALARQKLEKHRGATSLRWDWFLHQEEGR